MTLDPFPTAVVWIFIALVAVILVWAFWVRLRPMRSRSHPPRPPILDQLRAANAEIAAVVAAEQAIVAAIGALPENVAPGEAERRLRELTPGDNPRHDTRNRYLLMVHGWESQRKPQMLAALAGMALADASGRFLDLDEVLRRSIDEGGAVLVGQIATELATRQDELERWLKTGGVLLQLERAVARIGRSDPEIAARVTSAIASFKPRMLELTTATLRWYIAHWEEKEPLEPEKMAEALAPYCLPRFPELAAEAHAALSRRQGPEWDRAQVRFDSALIYHFRDFGGLEGFDFEAGLNRLCDAIMSPEASVSSMAASTATSLLDGHFYNGPEHRLRLHAALDWAGNVHGESYAYRWLAEQLQPPEAAPERAAEAPANAERQRTINDRIARLASTIATPDPEIALVELRMLLPDTPAEALRVALIARWKDGHAVVCLAALCGLVLELTDGMEQPKDLAGLCLHWSLRQGPAPLIEHLLALLSERFDRLDSWIREERSVHDLRAAMLRFKAEAPATATALLRLHDRVRQRRLVLLEAAIAERLRRAVEEGDAAEPFELVLDLYRLCLPGEERLVEPVRAFMRTRGERSAWRRALLHLESMTLIHFGAFGEVAAYDFDYLRDVLSDGLKDDDVEIAGLAALLAAKLIDKALITRIEDFSSLELTLKRAGTRFDPVPTGFAVLGQSITNALLAAAPR